MLATPANAQFFGGGSKGDRITWTLCAGAACATGDDLTARFIVTDKAKFQRCYAAAKTGPAGSALTFDVRANGTSVFGATHLLSIADGASSAVQSTFDAPQLAEGDLLTIHITQVGSTTPGQDVTITCKVR